MSRQLIRTYLLLIVTVLVGVIQTHADTTIEIYQNRVFFAPETHFNDSIYYLKNDSIRIDSICLPDNEKKGTLSIIKDNNDTIFQAKVSHTLSKSDIEKAFGKKGPSNKILILEANHKYTINHNSTNLIIHLKKEEETAAAPKTEPTDTINTTNENALSWYNNVLKEWSWYNYVLIVVAVIAVIAVVVIRKRLRRKKMALLRRVVAHIQQKRKGNPDPERPNPNNPDFNNPNPKDPSPKNTNQDEQVNNVLNRLLNGINGIDSKDSIEKKEEKIRDLLEEGRKNKKIVEEALNDIKIEEKENINWNSIKEAVYAELWRKIKKNEKLGALCDKVNESTNQNKVEKIISELEYQGKDNTNTPGLTEIANKFIEKIKESGVEEQCIKETDRKNPYNIVRALCEEIKSLQQGSLKKPDVLTSILNQLEENGIKFDVTPKDASELANAIIKEFIENQKTPSEEETSIIQTINEVLESNLENIEKDILKDTINTYVINYLKAKGLIENGENIEDVEEQLNNINQEYKETKKLEELYKTEISNLPKTIQEEQSKAILEQYTKEIGILFNQKKPKDIQKFIDLLINSLTVVTQNIEEELTSKEIEVKNKEVSSLFNAYKDYVKKQEEEKNELRSENETLMKESGNLVKKLQDQVGKIENDWNTLLIPCSDDYTEQCENIEDRLNKDFSDQISPLRSFNVDPKENPAKTRKAIQNRLIDELEKENSVINKLCCYYAYCKLPFMTDISREEGGVVFNRKNTLKLYQDIESLYALFGINFNIPPLFAMSIGEGDFEAVTNKEYGELENLCPGYTNHYENIDSKTKPSNLIVDIIKVGYTVEGELGRKASVKHF